MDAVLAGLFDHEPGFIPARTISPLRGVKISRSRGRVRAGYIMLGAERVFFEIGIVLAGVSAKLSGLLGLLCSASVTLVVVSVRVLQSRNCGEIR